MVYVDEFVMGDEKRRRSMMTRRRTMMKKMNYTQI